MGCGTSALRYAVAAAQPALQVKLRAERPAADPEFPRPEVIQPAQQRLWENDPNGSRTHLLDLANKSTSRSYMKDRGGGLFVFVEDSVGGERLRRTVRRSFRERRGKNPKTEIHLVRLED